LRAQATQLAYDLSDRMRANSAALAAYLGSGTADDCVANGCSPAQMAGYDLTQWTSAVAEQLPGGAGSVSQAAGIYTISVSWIEREQTGDVAQTFVTTLEP
jgi:type IV pilus assembly protein PilV